MYSARNVQTYLDVLGSLQVEAVLALSSGFMTYPEDAHPAYPAVYRSILVSSLTLVLVPSFDEERCVAETVRRQLARPFSRSAEREEQVVRARFGLYRGLPAKQFETTKSVDAVVDELASHVLLSL
jgi:shikimate kinase